MALIVAFYLNDNKTNNASVRFFSDFQVITNPSHKQFIN